MDESRRELLRWQFELTWSLFEYHLVRLQPDDYLWEPAELCWTLRQGPGGVWTPDWADSEPDPVPVPTIAWLTWHIGWWWTVTLDHTLGRTPQERAEIRWPGDDHKKRVCSLIEENHGKSVRMANLAVVGSHAVNGVAALHTELMKDTVFADLHKLYPNRINNKTNGITPRRWLLPRPLMRMPLQLISRRLKTHRSRVKQSLPRLCLQRSRHLLRRWIAKPKCPLDPRGLGGSPHPRAPQMAAAPRASTRRQLGDPEIQLLRRGRRRGRNSVPNLRCEVASLGFRGAHLQLF